MYLSAPHRITTGIGPGPWNHRRHVPPRDSSSRRRPGVRPVAGGRAPRLGAREHRTIRSATSPITSSTRRRTWAARSWIRSGRSTRRPDRGRGDLGAPPAGKWVDRPTGRRAVRSATGRLAHPFVALRRRGGRVALSRGTPPLALRLVGRVRGTVAGLRRSPHRAEPDGDAGHLRDDVRDGGRALPGARSRADGGSPVGPMAVDRSRLRLAVPDAGRRLLRMCGRDEVVGRVRDPAGGRALRRSWVFSGDRAGRRSSSRMWPRCWRPSPRAAVVYLMSYGAFFFQHGFAVHDFLALQTAMLATSRASRGPAGELVAVDLAAAPPSRPVPQGDARRFWSVVVALGNPVLWWGFLLLLPFALMQIVRRATWQDAVSSGATRRCSCRGS